MSLNHVLEDGNSEEEEGRISLRKKELEVFVIRTVDQRIHQVIEQNIVPMISRIVKQELESAVETLWARLNHHSGIGVQPSKSRTLQLKFLDKLSQPVLTNQMIKGEGNTPFRVALVDADTKHVVTEASAKVEIVVIDGDFDCEHWTVEEFNQKIVREWEGKKSLLTGNVHLNLESGVGFIREISFTHNSHWMKVCKLRLGAKVVDSFIGARIREAVTEPFILKDYREIYSNKPSAPSLNDEVWRLKKIRRYGPLHNRLVRENIKTVKDFLTQFFIDPQSLRNIIGTAKIWEATVDHARKCVLDKRLHLYFPIDSEKKSGVVFNDVGQVVGLISECCYVPLDMLSEDQKADANKLVVSALEPTKEVKSFDDEICMHSYLQSLNDAYPSNSLRLESPGHYSYEASQTHYGHDHTQPSTSSQDNQAVPFHLPDDANPSNIPSTDSLGIWSSVPSFGNASHLNEYGWQSIIAEDPINEGPLLSLENLLNPSFCYTESTNDLSSIVNGFLSTRAAAHIAQRRWSRAIATVRSVRKIIATFKLVSSEAVLASKRPRIY
ncbi:calmodulin-binding protein 60 A-like isoform X2 [Rhododendron vialii]|uniref:calmodulin-binding protein 60 A-like isoform X2 n=1 Tax=Rhododendron vialii TaxID=182163 RepID=UPI00265DE6A9|nr:calmodulin-binding protein 60 A-like isoform X2 [Rhododendron vialii]